MKRMLPVFLMAASMIVYIAGRVSRTNINPGPQAVLSGHFDDLSMIPSANAQENKSEVRPFGFNSPREPSLAPDAPPITYWNIDDIRKAHAELAEQAMKAAAQPGTGSSQSFGGGAVHIQTRNFSIFMLCRVDRDQPVLCPTQVDRFWHDAAMPAGAYGLSLITAVSRE